MPVQVHLRRDAGRPQIGGSPWIRRKSVRKILGPPDPGELAAVVDAKGDVVAHGLYSPDADLVVRIVEFGTERPDEDWVERRVAGALARRRALGLGRDTTGYREVNSEGDGLPGLTVDRYGDLRVVQLSTAPVVHRRDRILAALDAAEPRDALWIQPESAARREGFEPVVGGIQPPTLEYTEHGLACSAPAPPGQKTGAYHDQRENRRWLADLASRAGGPFLDVGCHVGGFAIHAATRGLVSVGLDASAAALDAARRNASLAKVEVSWVKADMFEPLESPELRGPFGTIVFDPPRVANSRRDLPRAVQAMSRACAQLVRRLGPQGLLAICSCSHHLDGFQLDRVAVRAGSIAGVPLRRVALLGPGPDHPVAPGHTEGDYLRVAVYQR